VIYWPFHRVGLVNNKHEVPDKSQPEPVLPVKQDVPLAKENLQCPTG
jgi:hypothetical protein